MPWLQSTSSKGKKPALGCSWSGQHLFLPQNSRSCCGRAVRWLNCKHGAPCNASQTPATHAHDSWWIPTLEQRQAGTAVGETSPLRDHSSLLPPWAPLHLPLIPPCFPPANGCTLLFQFVVIAVSFSFWSKLRTVPCTFLTFLPCFGTPPARSW